MTMIGFRAICFSTGGLSINFFAKFFPMPFLSSAILQSCV